MAATFKTKDETTKFVAGYPSAGIDAYIEAVKDRNEFAIFAGEENESGEFVLTASHRVMMTVEHRPKSVRTIETYVNWLN